jgi:hypothetical protein
MMKKAKKEVRKKSRVNEIEFSEITFILNRNEKIRIRDKSRDENDDQDEES